MHDEQARYELSILVSFPITIIKYPPYKSKSNLMEKASIIDHSLCLSKRRCEVKAVWCLKQCVLLCTQSEVKSHEAVCYAHVLFSQLLDPSE